MLALERGTQLQVVVDLAVENDLVAAVGTGHRLVTGGGKVEDCEPPMPEGDAGRGIQPQPLVIGAAVGDGIQHAPEHGAGVLREAGLDESRNAAHASAYRFWKTANRHGCTTGIPVRRQISRDCGRQLARMRCGVESWLDFRAAAIAEIPVPADRAATNPGSPSSRSPKWRAKYGLGCEFGSLRSNYRTRETRESRRSICRALEQQP